RRAKEYLDKIQFLAREGGLPEEEWKDITKFDKDICYEIDCLESALEVMTATNFSVNPCSPNKWLNFVCTRRVSGTDKKGQFETIMDVSNHQTKELLEDDSGNLDNEFLLKEAQTYYHQCKNKAQDDDKDVKTILKYLSKNYGDWPILTNRDPGEKFEWSEMVADLNRIERPGLTPLLFKASIGTFINRVFHGTDIEITPDTLVYLPVDTVMKILEATEKAEKRAVANVLNFQFASQLLLESTVLLDDLNTSKIFGYSLGTTYLNVYYNDDINTPAIESMMSKIQLGYMDVIDGLPWMEKSTKDFLKDKIQSMTTYITKPDWLRQPGALENFYNGLKASGDKSSSYPMNFLSISKWVVTRKRAHDHKDATRDQSDLTNYTIYDTEWSRYLGIVQAQFDREINQARIEGGIVQKPFSVSTDQADLTNINLKLKQDENTKNGELGEHWDATSVQKYEEWVESIDQDAGNVVYQMSETSAETLNHVKLQTRILQMLWAFKLATWPTKKSQGTGEKWTT
ncbi:Endothelin-converting enzyme 2, partial [Orchesella cincta]